MIFLSRLNWFGREPDLVVVLPLLLAIPVAMSGWSAIQPNVIDAGELAENPSPWLGRDIAVRGTWIRALPSESEYLIVALRGRNGISIECHCDDISAEDYAARDRLHERTYTKVTLHGRCQGLHGSRVVLRNCRLLD